jgi:xylose isomerase
MLAHLKSFELALKFSAGVWFFSPPQSRFHDRYKPVIDIPARLDIAATLKEYGLSAMEAHYPNEINEDNLDLWKQFTRDTGIRLLTVIPLLFWDADYEWGSLSSPIESIRHGAIERTKNALRLNKEFDADFAVVWPGIDGYEDAFGMDLVAARDPSPLASPRRWTRCRVCVSPSSPSPTGWLEAYLIRARAAHPDRLPPLPPLK